MSSSIPQLKNINGKKILFVDDKPFFMISGEIHNSSSSSMEFLNPVFDKLVSLGLNSALVPITWQIIEPNQGEFDFSLVDDILASAKEHGLKLGILWFGTWKNAQCSYVPDWVKADTKTYFRAELTEGQPFLSRKSGVVKLPYTTISPFCEAAMQADATAFAALMAHLRDYDADRTVITVQVENETGFLGGDMDYSPKAKEKYAQPVPSDLKQSLIDGVETLDPRIGQSFSKDGIFWEEVFGKNAHEAFIAYNTAKYVGFVAAAGKEEYPLPMSANCWLDGKKGVPGKYPCGGPVSKVMEIWRCAAPAIDVFAPDIYLTDFTGICDEFSRLGNPVYVPESKPCSLIPGRQLYILGHHQGLCFSAFGVEDIGPMDGPDLSIFAPLIGFAVSTKKTAPMDPKLYLKLNQLLAGMLPSLEPLWGTDRMDAYAKEKHGLRETFTFGNYSVTAMGIPMGDCKDSAALIAKTSDDEFLILNYGCICTIKSLDPEKPYFQFLSIEEGRFENGEWVRERILNGDEEMLIGMTPTLLKVRVNRYA